MQAKTPQRKSLPSAKRGSTENALAAIRDVMDGLTKHHSLAEIGYEVIGEPGGADRLLYCLAKGLQAI